MARPKKLRTLSDLDAEIARLQRERDAMREVEVKEVVGRIKVAIAHYGLTAADLGLAEAKRGTRGPSPKAKDLGTKRSRRNGKGTGAVAPKYTDGQGRTWSGRGRQPAWFAQAIASGKSPEDLRILPPA